MQLPSLGQLIKESLTSPRTAARRLLVVPFEMSTAVSLLLLAVIVGTLLAEIMRWMVPFSVNAVSDALLSQPLVAVGLQFGMLYLVGLMSIAVGRGFGGRGTLPQAISLLAWLQSMMILIQVVQFFLILVFPFLGALIGILSVLWFFWALSAFIAEMHGFQDVLKVLGMIIISMVALLIALAVLLAVLGVQVPEIS